MQPRFVLMRLIILDFIMRFSKTLTLFFLLMLSFLTAAAQDDEVIRVDSSIVRLNVGVVDVKGRPITSLTKENFTVYEDGIKQNILSFEPTVAPFSVVMILDMSGSTLGFRETIRQSAFRFVDALAPADRVAVIEFYDKVNLRTDFTVDRKKIGESIAAANGRGKTQLYKALDVALEKLSKEGTRRKAVIVLTDGVDSAVRDSDRSFLEKYKESEIVAALKPETSEILNRILSKSDAQGVTIYPLALPTGDPFKLADPTPIQIALFAAARDRLKILAARTGGTLNTINRLEEMGRLYAAVAADLRALYTVEYQPTNAKRDVKWLAIKIEVNNPELISKTRQGYFAK
ncbi:MAG: VWA domain-containing protein [Pyrinomonadaceae bacterium]|nr:VWA domain-containing protein [Pyrinomonadaceae bacterium]